MTAASSNSNKKSRAASVAAAATALCLCTPYNNMASAFTASPAIITAPTTRAPWDFALQVSAYPDSSGKSLSSLSSKASAGTTSISSSSATTTTIKVKKNKQKALDWDYKAVVEEIWKLDSRPIVMFDGDCNLCNGGVNLLLDMDTSNEFRFCSLSSKFGKSLLVAHGKQPDDKNNIMVIAKTTSTDNESSSEYLQKSQAVMMIASKLQGAPQWIKAMTIVGRTVAPQAVSDWLLQVIADNRYRIAGELLEDSCRLDLDGEFEGRFLNDWEHVSLFEPISSTSSNSEKKIKEEN